MFETPPGAAANDCAQPAVCGSRSQDTYPRVKGDIEACPERLRTGGSSDAAGGHPEIGAGPADAARGDDEVCEMVPHRP